MKTNDNAVKERGGGGGEFTETLKHFLLSKFQKF